MQMEGWNFTPVSIAYFLAGAITTLLTILGWRMRSVRGGIYFSFMNLSATLWIVADCVSIFCNVPDLKLLGLKFAYVGMALSVVFWVFFVANYTSYNFILKPFVVVLILLVPLFVFANLFLAPEHNLIHTNYHIVEVNGLQIYRSTFAFGFYIWATYAYLMLIGGMVLMTMRVINMPVNIRSQLYLLIPVGLVIIVPNFLHLAGKNPIYPYDPTSLSIAAVGVLFLVSIYRHRLMDVLPIAHVTVFNNMRSAVIVTDENLKVIDINPAAEALFNVDPKDLVGCQLYEVLPEVEGVMQRYLSSKGLKTEITFERISKVFELKISSVCDLKDRCTGNIFLLYDITEQKQAIQELDAYARTVAHDLKNPLNALRGYAQLLSSDEANPSKEEVDEYIKGIEDSAVHMNGIIESLLLLAKVRSVNELQKQDIDVRKCLNDTLDKLNFEIISAEANIEIQGDFPLTIGLSFWIEEVWTNLITNAIKYGGTKPNIVIESKTMDDQVYFYVKDNGMGLSPEEQKNVFVEFTRLQRHKMTKPGHGLGLSIVKRIIEKLDGTVGVESIEGQGSSFYFSLPKA